MKVKAAVLWEQGRPRPYAETRPMTIEEIDLDGPGPGEILIEVGGAGLCHSDLSAIEGLRARKLPTVPGHEGAGIVREVGPEVRGLKKGDHVVMAFVTSCGECRYCNGGRPNICTGSSASRADGTLLSGARRMSLGGQPVHHYSGLSLFSQFCVASANSAVKIDPDIPMVEAAIFGCAVLTGVGAALNTARVHAGSSVAVVGLGGVGMNALLGV